MSDSGQRETSSWQQRYEASLADAERERADSGGSESVWFTINGVARLGFVVVGVIVALIATRNVWLVSIGVVVSLFIALGIIGLVLERVRHQRRVPGSGK